LNVLSYYRDETNYTVWTLVTKVVRELETVVCGTSFFAKFKEFGRYLYSPVVQKLGWEAKSNESHLDAMLRALVLGMLGRYEDQQVLTESKKRFDIYLKDKKSLSPDIRRIVYGLSLAGGGRPIFDKLLKLYAESDLQEEQDRILRSLGSSTDVSILKDALNFSIGSQVRSQDSVGGIVAVGANPLGRELTWEFVKTNWSSLSDRYQGGFLLNSLIKESISYFSTEAKKKDVENFFATHPMPSGERAIKQGLEKTTINIKWLKRDEDNFRIFFNKFPQGPTPKPDQNFQPTPPPSQNQQSHEQQQQTQQHQQQPQQTQPHHSSPWLSENRFLILGGAVLAGAVIGTALYLRAKK